MSVEYLTTTTDLSPQDLDPFNSDSSVPDPVVPPGNGWRLIHTTTGHLKLYYVWQRGAPVVSTTSNYLIQETDEVILVDARSGNITVTLPFAISGTKIIVKKTDSTNHLVIIESQSGQLIDGDTSISISVQYNSFVFVSDQSNWFIV